MEGMFLFIHSDNDFFKRPFDQKKLDLSTSEIYHYTNTGGVLGIIENKNFFVSKSDFLNDSTEIDYFWLVFNEVIDDIIKNDIDGLEHKQENFKRFCEQFKVFAQEHSTLLNDKYEFYILSFSKNSDSLALWSNYAGNDGYNIKINLYDNLNRWDGQWDYYRYGSVIYSESTQKEIIKNEIVETFEYFYIDNHFVEYQERINAPTDKDVEEAVRFFINDGLIYRMMIWMLFFKNNLFSQEEEVRVIFMRFSLNFFQLKKQNLILKEDNVYTRFPTKFRVREQFITPYIQMGFDLKSIKGVKIDPNNKMDKAEAGLLMFLNANKIKKVEISKSDIPLRF
jgi:hypothetical protein